MLEYNFFFWYNLDGLGDRNFRKIGENIKIWKKQ